MSLTTFPRFDYKLWKEIALSGGNNVYYYASDGPGTGTYRGAPALGAAIGVAM